MAGKIDKIGQVSKNKSTEEMLKKLSKKNQNQEKICEKNHRKNGRKCQKIKGKCQRKKFKKVDD